MGLAGDYFLTPTPYTEPADPDAKRLGFLDWQEAGLPTAELVVEGGTHYEFSLIPTFPTTSWEAGGDGGWGRPLVEFYTLAWFDRWLKTDGETGFATADDRLLGEETAGPDDGPTWRQRLSFHHRSSRDFPGRDGRVHVCEDIRVGCEAPAPAPTDDPAPAPTTPASDPAATPPTAAPAAPAPTAPSAAPMPATGGGWLLAGLVVAFVAGRGRRR